MPKKDPAEKAAKRLAKLERIIADKSRPKAERKAAKRERAELIGATLSPVPEAQPAPTTEPEIAPEQVAAAAERVLADPGASEGAKSKARAAQLRAAAAMKAATEPEADVADEPMLDFAALAARVQAKRALRKAGLLTEGEGGELVVDPGAVPRDRADLVDAYNVLIGTRGGHYITSDDERAAIDARVGRAALVEPDGPAEPDGPVEAVDLTAPHPVEPAEVDGAAVVAALLDVPAPDGAAFESVTIAEHEAVEVETETGREFAVGPSVADLPLTKPSDAPPTLETDGLGRYKIKRLEDGKIVGYTRVTTYIDNLEDKSALDKWRRRILLEGLAVNEGEVGTREEGETLPPHLLAELRDALHRRDVAIEKARKAERKGKLKTGELGELIDDAWRDYKREADRIAEAALELGGVKDAARKGTDLHALTELHDREGIDAVVALLEAGEITRADFDDVEAYARALKVAGVKVLPEYIEQVVVNDERRVAGRLDRVVLYRFPGTARAVRCVLDVKTGRLDYGVGKIAQQLDLYSESQAYDLETHERHDMKLSRTKALVLSLPPGRAEATLHEVDLVLGRRGNKLSGEVRQWRNEGKRAIDLKVNLAAPSVTAAADGEGGES